jgi:hypothetical protein
LLLVFISNVLHFFGHMLYHWHTLEKNMCKIIFLLRFWKFLSTILSILYQLSNTYIYRGEKIVRCQYLDISLLWKMYVTCLWFY